MACFLETQRLFQCDLVERIHRHFDVGEINAAAVGPHSDFHVVVDDTLASDQDLQLKNPPESFKRRTSASLAVFSRRPKDISVPQAIKRSGRDKQEIGKPVNVFKRGLAYGLALLEG